MQSRQSLDAAKVRTTSSTAAAVAVLHANPLSCVIDDAAMFVFRQSRVMYECLRNRLPADRARPCSGYLRTRYRSRAESRQSTSATMSRHGKHLRKGEHSARPHTLRRTGRTWNHVFGDAIDARNVPRARSPSSSRPSSCRPVVVSRDVGRQRCS